MVKKENDDLIVAKANKSISQKQKNALGRYNLAIFITHSHSQHLCKKQLILARYQKDKVMP